MVRAMILVAGCRFAWRCRIAFPTGSSRFAGRWLELLRPKSSRACVRPPHGRPPRLGAADDRCTTIPMCSGAATVGPSYARCRVQSDTLARAHADSLPPRQWLTCWPRARAHADSLPPRQWLTCWSRPRGAACSSHEQRPQRSLLRPCSRRHSQPRIRARPSRVPETPLLHTPSPLTLWPELAMRNMDITSACHPFRNEKATRTPVADGQTCILSAFAAAQLARRLRGATRRPADIQRVDPSFSCCSSRFCSHRLPRGSSSSASPTRQLHVVRDPSNFWPGL